MAQPLCRSTGHMELFGSDRPKGIGERVSENIGPQ